MDALEPKSRRVGPSFLQPSRAPPQSRPDTGMGYTFVSRQGCECAPALDTTVPARGSQAVARAICLGERSVAQGRIIATQPEPAPAALAPEPEGPPPFEAEEADAASAMIARGQLRLCLGRQAEGLQSDVDQLHARGETDQPSPPNTVPRLTQPWALTVECARSPFVCRCRCRCR